jgi:hypothetical protein
MYAILTEHYAGKWPLWLSPRQVMVVPISEKVYGYADEVRGGVCSACVVFECVFACVSRCVGLWRECEYVLTASQTRHPPPTAAPNRRQIRRACRAAGLFTDVDYIDRKMQKKVVGCLDWLVGWLVGWGLRLETQCGHSFDHLSGETLRAMSKAVTPSAWLAASPITTPHPNPTPHPTPHTPPHPTPNHHRSARLRWRSTTTSWWSGRRSRPRAPST